MPTDCTTSLARLWCVLRIPAELDNKLHSFMITPRLLQGKAFEAFSGPKTALGHHSLGGDADLVELELLWDPELLELSKLRRLALNRDASVATLSRLLARKNRLLTGLSLSAPGRRRVPRGWR
jgi:hypothetical protein